MLYDSGMNREDSGTQANNIMSVFRNFIHENYLHGCEVQNGLPYCKNCGLSTEDII